MDNEICLAKKSCIPCQGGVSPLKQSIVNNLLTQLDNWFLNEKGYLLKSYKFSDFMKAMNFANKVAILAEVEAHHPNLKIAWGICEIEIWTHKINGLTESDFILAAKIDEINPNNA